MTNSKELDFDFLFFKVFRNMYLRKIISDIQFEHYKYEYELMLKDKGSIFKESIIKGITSYYSEGNPPEEDHIKHFTGLNHMYLSDLIIRNKVHIEDYDGHLIKYLNNLFGKLSEEKFEIISFVSLVKDIYNKSYISLSPENQKNVITLLLYSHGNLGEPICPIWKCDINSNNIKEDQLINNNSFLLEKYINVEKLVHERARMIDSFYPIIKIFNAKKLSSTIDMMNIYLIYIRCTYTHMEHIRFPDDTILYDTDYNSEYFSKLKSNISVKYRSIEAVTLLISIRNSHIYYNTRHLKAHIPYINYYYYMENRYTIKSTTNISDILIGLINNNINYKSIYMDVCNMIEEKRFLEAFQIE